MVFGQKKLAMILRGTGFQPSDSFKRRLTIPDIFKVEIPGTGTFIMTNTSYGLERALFWQGLQGHEPTSVEWYCKLVKECNWAIDVGANSGLYALLAKTVNPDITVFAFEPMPYFFQVLNQNTRLNGYDINAFELALSDQECELSFFMPEKGQGNIYSSTLKMTHYLDHQSSVPKTIKVQCRRLDSILSSEVLSGQGIIKIDAEGNDFEVMMGMGKYLSILKPVILVENRSEIIANKMAGLEGMEDYSYFSIPDSGERDLIPIEVPFSPKGRNVLCMPLGFPEFVQPAMRAHLP